MIGSLCSGYGGLELAVSAVLDEYVAWQSEIDPAACRVLEQRFPGVPNIGDMTAVDWHAVPPVRVMCGGTPCQDVSHAGKRAGMRAGTRSGLWSAMVDGIDVLRPELVVWENVRGVLSAEADSGVEPCPVCVGDGTGSALRALGRVLGDLAELGYDAGWCGLRASDVGAPHPRYRVFVVARDASHVVGERGGAVRGIAAGDAGTAGGAGASVEDTDQSARGERGFAASGAPEGAGGRAHVPTDTDRDGPHQLGRVDTSARDARGRGGQGQSWGPYEPAVRRWERATRTAPAPREPGRTGERLSPRFVEWMMGLPAGWVTDVPGISRADQLKMLGNGVVPQQAAAAITHLLAGEN